MNLKFSSSFKSPIKVILYYQDKYAVVNSKGEDVTEFLSVSNVYGTIFIQFKKLLPLSAWQKIMGLKTSASDSF
jgi:hypothetical protein